MRIFRSRAALSFVAIGTLTLTACSPGDGEDATRVSIASIMGLEHLDWGPENLLEQQTLVQEAIAECMAELGWAYVPVYFPDAYGYVSEDNEEELLKREGLGISYWTLHPNGDEDDDPWRDFVDPNQAIIDGLSEAQLTRYYEDLYGSDDPVIEVDPITGEEYYTHGDGCEGEAYDVVYSGGLEYDEDFWQALSVFYVELNLLIQADPRLDDLGQEWVACMAAAGFGYSSRNDFWDEAYDEYQRRHDLIVGPDFFADPFAGWTDAEISEFFSWASQAEIDALFDQQQELTEPQRAQLEALLTQEIDVALANFSCEKGLRDKEEELYAEIEETYVEDNRAALEELAATLRTG